MRSIAAALEQATLAMSKAKEEAVKHSKPKGGKVSGQSLVGPGFPGPGTVQPNYMGSQSASPNQMDNYTDTNMNQPPIDRGAYGPGL